MSDYHLENIVEPLLTWYAKNARTLPWRENTEPYRVWISEIMLQQTRVDTVITYYKKFLQTFPTMHDLATCEDEQLMKLWEGLGYYSRAKNLKKAAQIICEDYHGQFPTEFDIVIKLPGIGTYTAGAICSISFGKKTAAVDGNVLRVITRLTKNSTDIMNNKFREEVKKNLEAIYPKDRCGDFTQSLMELGAVICTPNGVPKCSECPLKEHCLAYKEKRQMEFPVKKKKAERKIENKTVFLLCYNDNIAISKREQEGLLAGMWEFPNIDNILSKKEVEKWLLEQEINNVTIQSTFKKKHIFSHIEWHMNCFVILCDSMGNNTNLKWVTKQQLENEIALPTAFKKIYKEIGDI